VHRAWLVDLFERPIVRHILFPAAFVLGERKQEEVVRLTGLTGVETNTEQHATYVGQHVTVVEAVASGLLSPTHELDRNALWEPRTHSCCFLLEELQCRLLGTVDGHKFE
jgi:hypothetical protein